MIEEFKKFIMRGNVLDMAVGIIIGAAFGKIVTSFVNDILMPPIGALIGNTDVRIFPLRRDLELEAGLIEIASQWWTDHVLADVPPALSQRGGVELTDTSAHGLCCILHAVAATVAGVPGQNDGRQRPDAVAEPLQREGGAGAHRASGDEGGQDDDGGQAHGDSNSRRAG